MVATYFLQALDKGTLSFTSIMGIQEDLSLKGPQYSWLTTCIYIAILCVEYPINWLIQRVPIAKFLGTCIIIWGSILAFHAASSNFAGIVTLRTLLGIFEAVCQPTFLIMVSITGGGSTTLIVEKLLTWICRVRCGTRERSKLSSSASGTV